MPRPTIHRLADYAESYEVRVGKVVIGRVFQSADVWKGADYAKNATPVFDNLQDGMDFVVILWQIPSRSADSKW